VGNCNHCLKGTDTPRHPSCHVKVIASNNMTSSQPAPGLGSSMSPGGSQWSFKRTVSINRNNRIHSRGRGVLRGCWFYNTWGGSSSLWPLTRLTLPCDLEKQLQVLGPSPRDPAKTTGAPGFSSRPVLAQASNPHSLFQKALAELGSSVTN
jgi:hypothetical protein